MSKQLHINNEALNQSCTNMDLRSLGDGFELSESLFAPEADSHPWYRLMIEINPLLTGNLPSQVYHGDSIYTFVITYHGKEILGGMFERCSIKAKSLEMLSYLKICPSILSNRSLFSNEEELKIIPGDLLQHKVSKAFALLCRKFNVQGVLVMVGDENDPNFNLIKELNPILVPVGTKWFFNRFGSKNIDEYIRKIENYKWRRSFRRALKLLESGQYRFEITDVDKVSREQFVSQLKMQSEKYNHRQNMLFEEFMETLSTKHNHQVGTAVLSRGESTISFFIFRKIKGGIELNTIGNDHHQKSFSSISHYHLLWVGFIKWFLENFPESTGFFCGIKADDSKRRLNFQPFPAQSAVIVYSRILKLFKPLLNVVISLISKSEIGQRI